MSNSRNLASLGTIVTSTAAKNVSFANTIANGFATAASTNTVNLNVTGNSNLTYILASNTITFNNTSTYNGIATYNSTVTFANAVTFSNTISVANINSTYIANTTFNNYKEQSYSNTSFGASYTVDLNQGTLHLLTLTSSTTIYMPTAAAGKSFTLIISTGSGGYTVSWNGVTFSDGVAPVATATSIKKDILSFISDGSSWFGFVAGQNF